VAAISHPSRRSAPPAWAGIVGIVLGSGIGAAACYALASLF
jgi:hypothetical protein